MSWLHRHPAALAVIALACFVVEPADVRAQLPEHRLQSIFPLGGRAGESIDVQFVVGDAEGVRELWFDHPGLRAFHLKGTTFKIAISPGTPAGMHDVRVVGPLGVSNPRTFFVGTLAELAEKEPNNAPETATAISRNAFINGRLEAQPDVDCFSFEAKKGDRIFFDLLALRTDSRVNGVLRVLDAATSAELGEAKQAQGVDPMLDFSAPYDGRFVLKVHDATYNGSVEHPYRLWVHDGPWVDAVVPVAVRENEPSEVAILGRNLGAAAAPKLFVDGRPLEKLAATVTPVREPDLLANNIFSTRAGVNGFNWRLRTEKGESNPVFIATSTGALTAEVEPNDDAAHAQAVALPCDVSGTFGAPGDVDIYRFSAKKGDIWWVEAESERIGSAADPSFVIQRLLKEGPQDVATADDVNDAFQGQRFPRGSSDAQFRFPVVEDGDYQVVLTDLLSSQRGDARLSYRLQIRRERPDFRLFVTPNDPGQIEALTVRAGGRASAYVLLQRIEGFDRPVRVEPRSLPPGVTADPVIIGRGQVLAPIVFTAAENAVACEEPIVLVGRAIAPDRKEILDYAPGARGGLSAEVEAEREAISGSLIWPPMNTGQANIGPARVTRGFVVAVRPAAPFQLTARPSNWVVAPGATLEIAVDVARRPGFIEAVQVTATDLPPNMGSASATIAKDATSAQIKLIVPANVPPGLYSFMLRGAGPFPFNKDPNAKDKPNVNVNEPSNPISLTVGK